MTLNIPLAQNDRFFQIAKPKNPNQITPRLSWGTLARFNLKPYVCFINSWRFEGEVRTYKHLKKFDKVAKLQQTNHT